MCNACLKARTIHRNTSLAFPTWYQSFLPLWHLLPQFKRCPLLLPLRFHSQNHIYLIYLHQASFKQLPYVESTSYSNLMWLWFFGYVKDKVPYPVSTIIGERMVSCKQIMSQQCGCILIN